MLGLLWCLRRLGVLFCHIKFFLPFFIFCTIFKGYNPFTVITKYWLYSPCCITHPCSIFHAQQFVPHTPPFLHCSSLPAGNHWFVIYIHESAILLQSLVCCICIYLFSLCWLLVESCRILMAAHELSSCGTWVPECVGSVVVSHGLNCFTASKI